MKHRIVTGQYVTPQKVARSRELRRNQTRAEKILWEHLRAERLNGIKFRRQQIIDGFIIDFYCDVAGLVIEVDGPIHQKQIDYDNRCTAILQARGLQVLRLSNNMVVHHLGATLSRISEYCTLARLS